MKRASFVAMVALGMALAGPAAADEIVIGVAGPFSGSYARLGEQIWIGASAAADQINAAGGVKGDQIRLVKGDDACEPKQAVTVANRLLETEGVAAVIGHACSSSSLPASEVYADADVLMITPASTADALTEKGYVTTMRMVGRDSQQGVIAAEYLLETVGAKHIAVIHDKDSYGMGVAMAVQAYLKDKGVEPILFEGLTRGEKDFNALVSRVKGLGADAVFFGGLAVEAGILVRQMREAGLDVPFVAGDGIASDDFIFTAGGGQFIDGVLMVFGRDARENPDSAEAVANLRARGFEPMGYTLYAYAAMQVIAIAVDNAGATEGEALGTWLRNNEVATVAGPKRWDERGDLAVPDFTMYRWNKDGNYAALK